MKKMFKALTILATALLLGTWLVTPSMATSGRDCDTNAVLYCGALTTTELANKINRGWTGPNQSPAELQSLFGHYGISTNDFGNLKNGYVTKSGEVWADGRRVATGAQSIGRHYIPGSRKLTFVNYPLYIRPTSVSFLSNSLEAFVYVNPDGSMAYAVIKSCGNIVPGVGKPHVLTIWKWEDRNGNAKKEADEPFLSGWSFRVSGNGINKTITTGANGSASISVSPNVYNVDEVMQTGWVSTTGTHAIAHMTGGDGKILFGNRRVRPAQTQLRVVKFNDADGDKIQDQDETLLSGWSFRVTGSGFDRTITTDSTGTSVITGLQPGVYTVTEINQAGWENTTGLTVQKNVNLDPATQTFVFGNKKIQTPPTPPQGGGELPTSGPAETAGAVFGSMSLSGIILNWVRSKKNLLSALRK